MVLNLINIEKRGQFTHKEIIKQPIEKHCDNESCNGIRFFDCSEVTGYLSDDTSFNNFVLIYYCRNCKITSYLISIRVISGRKSVHGIVEKYGEIPKYGLYKPDELSQLIKENYDKDLFTKGFECESDGKGIGAFTYYRRLVDSVKNQLIDEIAKAVSKIDSNHEMLEHLKEAKNESRFSNAISKIKDTLPKELYIDGQNPLTALYGALSDGLHEKTDDDCLNLAADIRIILTELFKKTEFILENKSTVSAALKRLM